VPVVQTAQALQRVLNVVANARALPRVGLVVNAQLRQGLTPHC